MSSSRRQPVDSDELHAKDCGCLPYFVTDVKCFDKFGIPPGMTLPGCILYGDERPQNRTIRHEMIHYHQYRELCCVFFLPLYCTNYCCCLAAQGWKRGCCCFTQDGGCGDVVDASYRENVFELEAYANQENKGYLGRRQHYAWLWRVFNARKYEENWS